MPAPRQAAVRLIAPEVKFNMAGVRPIACNAKNVTATPTLDGSKTPTGSRLWVKDRIFDPSAKAARMASR